MERKNSKYSRCRQFLTQDDFIIENLNEILHNIRFNYVCVKLKAYKVCKFDTLMRELEMEQSSLISLLFEIVLSGAVNAKLNIMENNIKVSEISSEKDDTFKNLKNWIGHLNNQ